MLEGVPSSAFRRSAEDWDSSPVILAHEHPFKIGAAEFRPATREVLFDGRSSVIEPRVMQLLVALYRAAGAVVSKDDLAATCWGGRIVGEDAINRVISRLRSVGEKQAGRQFRIETITKVGYRLTPVYALVDGAHRDEPSVNVATGGIARRQLIAGGSAAAIVASGALSWVVLHRETTPKEARLLIDDARKSLMGGDVNSPGNAVGTLRHATEIAPHNAEAWGLLAYAYMVAASAASSKDAGPLTTRGIAAIRRAFALDPHQPDALAARLWTIPTFGNWLNYEQACTQGLRYHPKHSILQGHLSGLLCSVGRMAEALALTDAALRAMPRSGPLLLGRAGILWSLGRLDEADAAVTKTFDLLPRNSDVWGATILYLMYNNRGRDALAMLADPSGRPLDMDQSNVDLLTLQARALTFGDKASAREALQIADQAARQGKGYLVVGSLFAAFIGDLDEAFLLLNAMYFNKGFRLPDSYFSREQGPYVGHERTTAFLFDRRMRRLRRDPRFAELTRGIGLDDYWARTQTRSRIIA